MSKGNGSSDSPRRVVVTGFGLISPVGKDVASSWEAMLAGKSGGGPVTHWETTDEYPCRIG
jgi:3-oxoacyl-[acyl-carrier-protein] synthase II